jgi:hypothetical protein
MKKTIIFTLLLSIIAISPSFATNEKNQTQPASNEIIQTPTINQFHSTKKMYYQNLYYYINMLFQSLKLGNIQGVQNPIPEIRINNQTRPNK